MPWFSFRGSLIGLQSSGYQLVDGRLKYYDRLLTLCDLDQAEREQMINSVRDALENRLWGIIPYPKYDFAFARLFHIRNLFCQKLPLAELIGSIVYDIHDDLDYPGVTPEQAALLKDVENKLRASLERNDEQATLARTQLEELSQLASQARQAHWLKVNMSRNRLALMGILGLILLILAIRFKERSLEWFIALFDVLGGLVSAVMTTESVDTRISEYYLNRRLLYLRPVIGGIIALIVYKALVSKLISISGVGPTSSDDTFLVIAFVSGFAERAFVSRLLALANIADGASTSTVMPRPPSPAPGTTTPGGTTPSVSTLATPPSGSPHPAQIPGAILPGGPSALSSGGSQPPVSGPSEKVSQAQSATPAAFTSASTAAAPSAPAIAPSEAPTIPTAPSVMAAKLGILAYGSMIDSPGEEIEKRTAGRITNDVETPFNVEFGRSSSSRAGAPTLVPMENYGCRVKATIITLTPEVDIEEAEDCLYRREIHRVASGVPYPRDSPGDLRIKYLKDFHKVETVLYTALPPNIEPLTAAELARRAHDSLLDGDTVKCRLDGITYLISCKRNHIETPLTGAYEAELLRQFNVASLEEILLGG